MNIKVDIEKTALPNSVYFNNLNPGDFFVGDYSFTIYVKIEETEGKNCFSFYSGKNECFAGESYVIPINMEIEVTP